jgi:hypothetical protein
VKSTITIFPISVEPRAQANRMGLHPPWENSFEVVPVWRISMGVASARPRRTVNATVVKSIVPILSRLE